MKKLDSELEKFRMELEADNSGISERIEKKRKLKPVKSSLNGGYPGSNDLDYGRQISAGDKRNSIISQNNNCPKSYKMHSNEKYTSPATTPVPNLSSTLPRRQSECSLDSYKTLEFSPNSYMHGNMGQEGFLFNDKSINHVSRTSSGVNLQEKQKESDSLNSSNRRINRTVNPRRSAALNHKLIYKEEESSLLNSTDVVFLHEDSLSNDPIGPNSTGQQQSFHDKSYHRSGVSSNTFSDKRSNHSGFDDDNSSIQSQTSISNMDSNHSMPIAPAEKKTKLSGTINNSGNDEDLQLYCICRNVSYGDMIACDNPNCLYEWFHYECVGLSVAPRGQWFCTSCQANNLQTSSNASSTASNVNTSLSNPNLYPASANNANSLNNLTSNNKTLKKKSRR